MNAKTNTIIPDYRRIYTDILDKKYPHKKEECRPILEKECLSALDIITLNKKIFGINIEAEQFNQRHRSYNRSAILKILDYQKKNRLNNSMLARHFNLSRNTVTRWKKIFMV